MSDTTNAADTTDHNTIQSRTNAILRQLDPFTRSYAETALWSSHDESDDYGGEPMDRNYGPDDIHPDTLTEMAEDCRAFQEANRADITEEALVRSNGYSADDMAGHDFWLTRNGHGAGFWDGDWEEDAGERLTGSSEAFGEYNLYVGDDGWIHGCKG